MFKIKDTFTVTQEGQNCIFYNGTHNYTLHIYRKSNELVDDKRDIVPQVLQECCKEKISLLDLSSRQKLIKNICESIPFCVRVDLEHYGIFITYENLNEEKK